jgi:hypothetical protein
MTITRVGQAFLDDAHKEIEGKQQEARAAAIRAPGIATETAPQIQTLRPLVVVEGTPPRTF